jgi:hypothetical protein
MCYNPYPVSDTLIIVVQSSMSFVMAIGFVTILGKAGATSLMNIVSESQNTELKEVL